MSCLWQVFDLEQNTFFLMGEQFLLKLHDLGVAHFDPDRWAQEFLDKGRAQTPS